MKTALSNSPEIKSRNKMIEAADTKLQMAKKEYYPDFSINAGISTAPVILRICGARRQR